MKNITKINPDPGAKEYNVVNMAGDQILVHGAYIDPYPTVDLGLPSGTLWAKWNIGATNEEEAGLYFQWGDVQGYTAEQVGDGEGLKAFSWADYKFSIDGSSTFSKYNSTDGKMVLDLEDDAANVIMGGNWRMPTTDDFAELCQNTDLYLIQTEGEEIKGNVIKPSSYIINIRWESNPTSIIKGMKFYKKNDRETYLFVPLNGTAYDGSLSGVNTGGRLWLSSLFDPSSTISPTYYGAAYYFFFQDNYSQINTNGREVGIPIRGIKKQ